LSTYGLADPTGYVSLLPTRLDQLVTAGDPTALRLNRNAIALSHPSQRLLDVLQVAYVLSPKPLDDPGVHAEFLASSCQGDSGEITSARTAYGSFVVRTAAINRLDVQFRLYPSSQANGTLLVRLWQGTDRARLVLESRKNVAELANQPTATFYFAPEKNAPGQTYTWEISSEASVPHTGAGVCLQTDGQPALSVYGVNWAQVYEGETYVFERLAPLPRAYTVYAAESVSDDATTIRRLLDEAFDLRNTAIVASAVDMPTTADRLSTPAEVTSYEPNQVTIKATALAPGLLVLEDQFYPGWIAYVDGHPASIVRTNLLMRGVALPPGEHQIVFQFSPHSLYTGMGISLAGLALTLGLMVAPGLRRHPR
jgi:hypothetical protein